MGAVPMNSEASQMEPAKWYTSRSSGSQPGHLQVHLLHGDGDGDGAKINCAAALIGWRPATVPRGEHSQVDSSQSQLEGLPPRKNVISKCTMPSLALTPSSVLQCCQVQFSAALPSTQSPTDLSLTLIYCTYSALF
mmetsp:Transcript_155685/g.270860  ORF Transcript_155685/g.270860 Transcript_155685/m.270860 type:complete len:136 (-) Transcript_155685:315-722(-)